MTHRIAVSRLHLPDGSILVNQVLEYDGERLLRYFPLTEELPFTQWIGGDYELKETDLPLL